MAPPHARHPARFRQASLALQCGGSLSSLTRHVPTPACGRDSKQQPGAGSLLYRLTTSPRQRAGRPLARRCRPTFAKSLASANHPRRWAEPQTLTYYNMGTEGAAVWRCRQQRLHSQASPTNPGQRRPGGGPAAAAAGVPCKPIAEWRHQPQFWAHGPPGVLFAPRTGLAGSWRVTCKPNGGWPRQARPPPAPALSPLNPNASGAWRAPGLLTTMTAACAAGQAASAALAAAQRPRAGKVSRLHCPGRAMLACHSHSPRPRPAPCSPAGPAHAVRSQPHPAAVTERQVRRRVGWAGAAAAACRHLAAFRPLIAPADRTAAGRSVAHCRRAPLWPRTSPTRPLPPR